ncbi:ATP-NAD kinase family protein [Agromyces aerolatus]|uniref:ATP-NAD kinase family protein n=1 Tax=Agromyces sp. LY-1074 TaxID=3074080 RepID=UPI0028615599|nr:MULTISPECIES: NAD(+)/NADH kinase [unclassified Agromyces]MDR5700513.1 NAD(+)/NADH kinase [Agromyces sp. LY-1074]MDR5707034.1 NAD(+)/NADH kinase [Agromyces sp. LY-1358]
MSPAKTAKLARDGVARLGILVNPVAGMGGPLALHGTDGEAMTAAVALGAQPTAELRMRRALESLGRRHPGPIEILTAPGSMGADAVVSAGLEVAGELAAPTSADATTADDTRRAALDAVEADVDLLLFGGGDGTATDIARVVGDRTVVLGVPSGVKMHSGVFAIDPERAGRIAAAYLQSPTPRPQREAEVVDVPTDELSPRTIERTLVPRISGIQNPKASAASDDAGIAALGVRLAEEMQPDRLYLIGPGRSAGAVLDALGLAGTRNGVDAVIDGRIVALDAAEPQLLDLVRHHSRPVLVLGVVGGQGFLLGRGNQQLSAQVLAHIHSDDLIIVAAADKVSALQPPVLHVDLGPAARPPTLRGYRTVRTAPARSVMLRIEDEPIHTGEPV